MGWFKQTPAQPSPTAEQKAGAASQRAAKKRDLEEHIRVTKRDIRDAQQSGVPNLVAQERKSLTKLQRMLRDL